MWIVYLILLGLVAGALARFIMPGRQSMGVLMTIVLGIAGSFLGHFLSSLVMDVPAGGVLSSSLLWSVVGALVLLFGYSVLVKRDT